MNFFSQILFSTSQINLLNFLNWGESVGRCQQCTVHLDPTVCSCSLNKIRSTRISAASVPVYWRQWSKVILSGQEGAGEGSCRICSGLQWAGRFAEIIFFRLGFVCSPTDKPAPWLQAWILVVRWSEIRAQILCVDFPPLHIWKHLTYNLALSAVKPPRVILHPCRTLVQCCKPVVGHLPT